MRPTDSRIGVKPLRTKHEKTKGTRRRSPPSAASSADRLQFRSCLPYEEICIGETEGLHFDYKKAALGLHRGCTNAALVLHRGAPTRVRPARCRGTGRAAKRMTSPGSRTSLSNLRRTHEIAQNPPSSAKSLREDRAGATQSARSISQHHPKLPCAKSRPRARRCRRDRPRARRSHRSGRAHRAGDGSSGRYR